MRIVGGQHRGRTLLPPAGRDVRPTSDRTRQALFNILAHGAFHADGADTLDGRVVLDAFCGTGALGLEALSRGARAALFLDLKRASLSLARTNAQTLRETARCHFVQGDALRPPALPHAEPSLAAELAFLDPPYGMDLPGPALVALDAAGWLAQDVVAVLEMAAGDAFTHPDGFTIVDDRRYGDTRVVMLTRE